MSGSNLLPIMKILDIPNRSKSLPYTHPVSPAILLVMEELADGFGRSCHHWALEEKKVQLKREILRKTWASV